MAEPMVVVAENVDMKINNASEKMPISNDDQKIKTTRRKALTDINVNADVPTRHSARLGETKLSENNSSPKEDTAITPINTSRFDKLHICISEEEADQGVAVENNHSKHKAKQPEVKKSSRERREIKPRIPHNVPKVLQKKKQITLAQHIDKYKENHIIELE